MSEREEKLWNEFLQAIRDCNEDTVGEILVETRNLNLGGGKTKFLTRKITTTQGKLTVLHLAVKNGAERIIKLLFDNGVNVNATSQPHKFTALHMAVEQDNNGIIQLLLSRKEINVNACDEYGHTPLKLAAEKGNQQTVKWLIEKEADITKADSVDNTAIHVAADKGHYGVLQLLLSSVAFAKNPGIIGKQNKDKNTPLHLAVARECQNCVALLLCYGAVSSLELENRHNETPKQLAKGNKGILELLENPLKARQHLIELTRPVVKEIGRGGSVEADSDRYPVTEQIVSQPTSTSLATVLSQATPGFQPTIMYVTTPQVTVKNEYHTTVGNRGYAAIGPHGALHVAQSAMTTCVQPQLPSTGESSYSINMSGGHASIGDHSVTNVGTATPRTPGSEKLTEDHFELPKRTTMASEGLECSICCERFDEEELCPRLLSCGHSFCSSCLEKLFIDYAIKCPTCRSAASVPAGVTGLPKNFALLGVLQATPQTPADGNGDLRVCEVCDDEKHPATSCCLDCREDMCKDVARWHTRQKTTREHRVVSLKELKANPKLATIPLFCPEHNEQYRFFDEECNHVVCRDCVTLKHNGHKCLSLAEAASKYRQEMEALATKASAHADGIKAAEARVAALSLDLNKAYEEQTAQIKGAFKEQFYAQMGKSFKMSGKGGSVEHDGDKDPVTELKPQDSHDTGLPGATTDIEEEKCFSRLKPLDTAHWKKRLENVVTTAIDFEAKHKECVRVLPYTDDDHIKVQLYVFSGKSGVPQELKDAAQECFGGMKVKLEWFDLYNDATEILKVTPIEFPSGKPERFNESQIYEINEIINKNLHVFVKHRNVTAVQASFKIINSKQTKQPCIAIYVLGKGSIPVGEIEFPRTLGGYNVDVVDGFWFTTGEDDPWRPNEGQQQCEVLCLGASIGVEGEEGCGTLGAIVEGDGNFYALSCDHVMKRAQKSEIIHPARDDYLNYLNYHLQQYVERIQYIIKREQCFLAETISKFSFGIIKDLESVKTKFQELISLKEEHFDQDRAKKGNLEKAQLHEKALENGFKTPPRVIGWYIAGISRNMMWTDDQEYFIDAAIAQLTPKEVKGLRESETVEMIGTGKSPSGRCSSKFTAFGELCKSGRTTEYTNSGRHANPNVYLRLTSYRLNAQNEHLIDVVKRVSLCHTCANLAGVQEDLEPTFPPSCVCCTVDKKTLNDKVWWKNCLCIDRPYDPAKGDAFSAGGDSGAVIFEIEKNKSLLGFGIIFAQQCHSYGSCALASPLLPALQTLSREIPVNESLSLCSNVVGIPSDSDTGELPWGCNIG